MDNFGEAVKFSEALLIYHFMKSYDVIKEKGSHVKYPTPRYLLQHFLADKSCTASRIAPVLCTTVMVLQAIKTFAGSEM